LSEHLGRALKGARTLVIGVAYKKNIDDMRESPALKIIELLEKRGAVTSFHDPYFPEIGPTREHPGFTGRKSAPLTAALLAETDVAVICTDHDGIDYQLIADRCPLIIDTRNAFAARGIVGGRVVKA
jgi:UDP-N-acetyl-D-glucosamine dehydrogenase